MEPDDAEEGDLKLVQESRDGNVVDGIVGIFSRFQWSFFCASRYNDTEGLGEPVAAVMCRQLGYSDVGKIFLFAFCAFPSIH